MTAQQLKNSILQMAVQGKLVPQDPGDEPASVLLERIKAEKQELIKAGKIKKDKKSSEIFRGATHNLPYAFCEQIGKEIRDISDEIPFEIPDSWEWVRCSTLGAIIRGSGIKRTETVESGLPCVRYGELYTTYNTSFTETISFISKELFEQCKQISCGDVLFTLTGENKPDIAKTVAYLGDSPVAVGGDLAYWTHHGMNPLYLVYFMSSPYAIGRKVNLATGDIIVHISGDKVGSFLIPVPPLVEQDRIVAQINELEPIIQEYHSKEQAVSALNTTFPEALKKSILQEAVQGKLVPQDPNDEPASVLLERIKAEKQSLIKQGKIKKDKHESAIIARDKIPYEIPVGWEWCRLSDIVSFIGGYAYNSSDFISASRNQVLRLGNVKPDELKLSVKPVFISNALAEATTAFRCKTDDILLTMTGTRNKRDYFFTVRILREEPPLFINQRVGCLRAYISYMAHWLTWILKSETVLSQVFQYETGTANQGNLGAENIMKTLIPLPPLAEQKRIVAKIEGLMQYCDKL